MTQGASEASWKQTEVRGFGEKAEEQVSFSVHGILLPVQPASRLHLSCVKPAHTQPNLNLIGLISSVEMLPYRTPPTPGALSRGAASPTLIALFLGKPGLAALGEWQLASMCSEISAE